jgi:hypothetical protein
VTTLAKQRQKLSKYKLWRVRFIILTLRHKIKAPIFGAFFVRRNWDENPGVRPDDLKEESTRSVIPHSPPKN